MKKPEKVRIHALVPASVRDLADKIASKRSAEEFEFYSRSDVVAQAIRVLAKKEKVA